MQLKSSGNSKEEKQKILIFHCGSKEKLSSWKKYVFQDVTSKNMWTGGAAGAVK